MMKRTYDLDWLVQKVDQGESLKFLFFWGHTPKGNDEAGRWWLSQWFAAPFELNGRRYPTAEHWMMAAKAQLFEDELSHAKILQAESPKVAKNLGRQVLGFDETIWAQKRFEIVCIGSIHKFNQNRQMGEYLLNTNQRILVEASPVDTVWGIGLSPDSKEIHNVYAWRGQNLLGFALMVARDFLTKYGFFDPPKLKMLPPWVQYPDIDSLDMFWKMGEGKDYIGSYLQEYGRLSERNQAILQVSHPLPRGWERFYGKEGAIL